MLNEVAKTGLGKSQMQIFTQNLPDIYLDLSTKQPKLL